MVITLWLHKTIKRGLIVWYYINNYFLKDKNRDRKLALRNCIERLV